jgi:hypothetical protein
VAEDCLPLLCAKSPHRALPLILNSPASAYVLYPECSEKLLESANPKYETISAAINLPCLVVSSEPVSPILVD